jgi:hypothetical protein
LGSISPTVFLAVDQWVSAAGNRSAKVMVKALSAGFQRKPKRDQRGMAASFDASEGAEEGDASGERDDRCHGAPPPGVTLRYPCHHCDETGSDGNRTGEIEVRYRDAPRV